MLVKAFVDEGLGNSSYVLASETAGVAAVVDPQRDIDRCLQVAEGLGLKLKYVLETHLHADFISGGREATAQVGSMLAISQGAELEFEHLALKPDQTLELGDLRIAVLATPGHTPEHLSYTVSKETESVPGALFSGGALIVGGAARTDLVHHDLTEPLARQLFHSIQDTLLALPDDTTVYPTHGAGSFCSAPVSDARVTTIGQERRHNRLARARNEDEFVRLALEGLPSYPDYFAELRGVNQRGPRILGGVPEMRPLTVERVAELSARGHAVVDARPAQAFAAAHIPESLSVALRDAFGTWVGWVVPFGTPLVLVTDEDPEHHEWAMRQLMRIGYDDVAGYLAGGIAAWQESGRPVASWGRLGVEEVRARLERREGLQVLDVRLEHEWQAGHIPGARHAEAGRLRHQDPPLDRGRPLAVHCGHEERAATGLSVLARQGWRDLRLIEGGWDGWLAAAYPVARGDE